MNSRVAAHGYLATPWNKDLSATIKPLMQLFRGARYGQQETFNFFALTSAATTILIFTVFLDYDEIGY